MIPSNWSRNDKGNQVIVGKLSFAAMEEAYQYNTFGYSEPDQILASGDTYNRVKRFMLEMCIKQIERGIVISPKDKLMFNSATLLQDYTIPEGEIHFVIKGLDNPRRVAILKLED